MTKPVLRITWGAIFLGIAAWLFVCGFLAAVFA